MDQLDLSPRNITDFLPELCDGEAITNRTVRSYVSCHLPQEYVEQDIRRIEGEDAWRNKHQCWSQLNCEETQEDMLDYF